MWLGAPNIDALSRHWGSVQTLRWMIAMPVMLPCGLVANVDAVSLAASTPTAVFVSGLP
jgi:hypothetical protein